MDSKEIRKQQKQQQNLQPPRGMLTGSFDLNAAASMSPASTTSQAMHQRSSVGDLSPRQPQQPLGLDGSPSSSVATQQSSMQVRNEQRGGRGRGRPRKYASAPESDANSSDHPPAKRGRGRLPGSRNKKKLDVLGGAERSLRPHTINVNPGEDIATKVVEFMSQEPRETCILSASGAISFALIQVTNPRGVLKCEGRYNIVNMSGSVLNTENSDGTVTRAGSLRVSITGPNGRVLGGTVAGRLLALSPVQVVVGSFVRERVNVENNPEPASATEGPPRPSESSEKKW